MPGPRTVGGPEGHRWRLIVLIVGAAAVADALLWSAHVVWRDAAMRDLAPLVGRIEALADQIAADDAWISRNRRLLQGYGQHEELARRMSGRGRRARAYAALVDAYNRRVAVLYRRFYIAPLPAPAPPMLEALPSPEEGSFPTR